MKKLKKMPKLVGTAPLVYKREVLYNTCLVVNAHADAIDYLYQVAQEQEREIQELRNIIKSLKGKRDG